MRVWCRHSLNLFEITLILAASISLVFRYSHLMAVWSVNHGVYKLESVAPNGADLHDGATGRGKSDCEAMLTEFQRSVALQPSVDVSWYLLAQAQYKCQDYEGATESALNLLRLQPKTDLLYDSVSRILVESYIASDYKADLETLLQGSRDITTVLINQGDESLNSGNLSRARELSELGIRMSRSPSSFYLRLGEVHQQEHSFDQSLEIYEMALELDAFHSREDKSRTYVKHGEILFWTGRDIAQSIKDFDAAIYVQPTSYSAHVLKGLALFRYSEDWKAAQEEIQAAIAINPSKKEALMALGNLYREIGQKEAAKQAYLEVLERDPEDREALQALEALQ